MEELQSPITTIPGMGFRMAAMILAEIGDFSFFDSPDKILAYAGMSPSTYNQGIFHWLEPTLTWRNEALATCAMRFTTRPSMSAIGIRALRLTLLKSELKESITMLHFLMPLRNWFG